MSGAQKKRMIYATSENDTFYLFYGIEEGEHTLYPQEIETYMGDYMGVSRILCLSFWEMLPREREILIPHHVKVNSKLKSLANFRFYLNHTFLSS